MSEKDEIIKLLTEIRDNQRRSLQRQEEHLVLAREQSDRSRNQVAESIGLQRQAMDRFRKLSRVALPAMALCIVLIFYLLIRYF